MLPGAGAKQGRLLIPGTEPVDVVEEIGALASHEVCILVAPQSTTFCIHNERLQDFVREGVETLDHVKLIELSQTPDKVLEPGLVDNVEDGHDVLVVGRDFKQILVRVVDIIFHLGLCLQTNQFAELDPVFRV